MTVIMFGRQDGVIQTEVVYAILLQSKLPREVLGYIWGLCNKTTPGQLTRQELFLILAMISIAQVSVLLMLSFCFFFYAVIFRMRNVYSNMKNC